MSFENAIIFRQQRLAYIGIPKAANSSVKSWLLPLIGMQSKNERNVHNRDKFPFEYIDIDALARMRNDVFIFTVVRNPWSRLYAAWCDKVCRPVIHEPFARYGMRAGMSFPDFVHACCRLDIDRAEVHIRSQYSMLRGRSAWWRPRVFLPHLCVRMEELPLRQAELEQAVSARCPGTRLGALPVRNSRSDGDYRAHYTPELVDRVYDAYRRDVTLLGYEY